MSKEKNATTADRENMTIETVKEWTSDNYTKSSLIEVLNELPADIDIRVDSFLGDEPMGTIQLVRCGEKENPSDNDYLFLSLLCVDHENSQECFNDAWRFIEKIYNSYRKYEIALKNRQNGNVAAGKLADSIGELLMDGGYYDVFMESEKEA
jgi:hypothetical protein